MRLEEKLEWGRFAFSVVCFAMFAWFMIDGLAMLGQGRQQDALLFFVIAAAVRP